jgi:gamma-glutamyltranspeptidase/glutathione hydrolase
MMIIWKQRMSNFSFEKTLSSDIKEGKVTYNESTETTHYSIVISLGMPFVNNNIKRRLWFKYYCDELGFSSTTKWMISVQTW